MREITQSSAPVQTSTEPEVERLAREVAELRAARVADRAELEAVRAQVMGQKSSPEPDAPLGEREELSKRRFARRRHNGSGEHSEPSGLMSRRRLFGLLGGAAAAGAGLAVAGSTLTADPAGATVVTAGAADGDALMIGGVNNCTNETGLTSTQSSTTTFVGISTATNGRGIGGACDVGSGAVAVFGTSATGYGLKGTGGMAPLWLFPAGSVGAPTTGTHNRGEFVVDSNGTLFTCVVPGTPGTWLRQSPLVTIPPARVYDSRVGQLPSTAPKSKITPGSTVNVDVTGTQAAGGPSGVPSGVSGVLGNITVVVPSAGVALTVFGEGATQPATSNINCSPAQVVANNFTSKVGTSNGISIFGSGGPTDFVIDIFGYYP
jgi:hypothetical protein